MDSSKPHSEWLATSDCLWALLGSVGLLLRARRPNAVTARARHILVGDEQECRKIKAEIENGIEFASAARACSRCASARRGGDLGRFRPGEMVPEFNEVVLTKEIGKVHGPIKTRFGYHLIEITERSGDAGDDAVLVA